MGRQPRVTVSPCLLVTARVCSLRKRLHCTKRSAVQVSVSYPFLVLSVCTAGAYTRPDDLHHPHLVRLAHSAPVPSASPSMNSGGPQDKPGRAGVGLAVPPKPALSRVEGLGG